MAELNHSIPKGYEPPSFEPIPAGWYTMEIMNSDVKLTLTGYRRLEIELKVYGPDEVKGQKVKGRQVWDGILLEHPNQQALEIHTKRLEMLIYAAGLQGIRDTVQLHGRIVKALVKIQEKDDVKRNEISFYDLQDGTPQAQSEPPQQAPARPKAPSARPQQNTQHQSNQQVPSNSGGRPAPPIRPQEPVRPAPPQNNTYVSDNASYMPVDSGYASDDTNYEPDYSGQGSFDDDDPNYKPEPYQRQTVGYDHEPSHPYRQR